MNEQSDLMKIVCNEDWRQRHPIISMPEPKVVKEYNPSEIYDDPAAHCTVRGIFAYTGVEII
jgi:hypothetical protein